MRPTFAPVSGTPHVWILTYWVCYDGETIRGVYGDVQKATAAATKLIEKERVELDRPSLYATVRTFDNGDLVWEEDDSCYQIRRYSVDQLADRFGP